MIVVTGAGGQLGRAVVETLLHRVEPSRIVATARDPNRVAPLSARGVTVRAADFSQASSLRTAFAGARTILLVSVDRLGDEARLLHRNAIEAARDSGAERVLYTSHMGARAGSAFIPADDHAAAEAELSASAHTGLALRHGFYAESCLGLIGDDFGRGELRVPEDGPVSWTARDDLAEADAAILAGEADWSGVSPPLTAAAALTMAELAALASEIHGRPIRHVTVSDDEWLDAKVSTGMPRFYADALLGMFRAARRGDFAATDGALEALLGRPPRTMREMLAKPR